LLLLQVRARLFDPLMKGTDVGCSHDAAIRAECKALHEELAENPSSSINVVDRGREY
jgi:hypothetical protein